MAQVIDADDKVARFRAEVLPRLVARYRPNKVLVFGSRARGDALRDSDLDVLIVSAAFEGVRWLDRQGRVYEACDVHLDVELLCYTPEEYARKVEELGIVRTATAEGVAIVGRPPGLVGEARRPGRDRVLAWLAQAERDLDAAEVARRAGHHEWACFAAQQGAEKAVKALHLHLGGEARGHAVASLLRGLAPEVAVPSEFEERARALDKFYVEARYPNTHPYGAPFEHYGPLQSEQGIGYAREIVAFCRSQMT